MVALPIPEKTSPYRYNDLRWRGRDLGDVVEKLTRGKQRGDFRAHLDPDLRQDICRRHRGWRPAFGQVGPAQGHLRKHTVGAGDLFLFWGLFRKVDSELQWIGRAEHHIWGWLQIASVAAVDNVVRRGGEAWRWAREHPHYSFPPDPSNTLYIATERLSLPRVNFLSTPGSGVFDFYDGARRLTHATARGPSFWSLPSGFFPGARAPLSYHARADRWSLAGDRVHLRTVGRGQEFVLDLEAYPELTEWLVGFFENAPPHCHRPVR